MEATIKEYVNHRIPAAIMPWMVCLSSALFFFYVSVQMNMFNAIDPGLIRSFNLDAVHLGRLSSCYLAANMLFLFPAGLLLDRFSARKVIIIMMSVSVLLTFLFSTAQTFRVAFVINFLAGLCGSFCFLASMKLATRWLPPQRMAFISGLIVTFAMLGGVFAQTPLTLLTEAVGWRYALICVGCMGLMFVSVIWAVVHDYPRDFDYEKMEDQSFIRSIGFVNTLKHTVLNKQNWFCGIYISLLNLPITLLGAVWGGLYLIQVRHFSHTSSSYITTMLFLGVILASPIIGWISDQIRLRKVPMLIGSFLSLIVMLIIIYTPHLSFSELAVLFFSLGVFSSSQVIGYPTVAESNVKEFTATSLSLASIVVLGGGTFFQPIFGWITGSNWDGTILNNLPIYSAEHYRSALLILPIACIVSMVVTLAIKETHCREKTAIAE